MKTIMKITLICFLIGLVLISCNKSNDPAPVTGTLKGMVTSSSNGQAIGNVRILVYDANTNAPIANSVLTQSGGSYQIELAPGTYYLNLSKQGYNSVPFSGITPVPVTVDAGIETTNDYQLQPSSVTNGGSLTGKVTSGGNGIGGVLVVAGDATKGYSSVTATDGTYYIYNVPAGTYQVKGYLSNYNSAALSVAVTAGAETSGNNIALTLGAGGTVTGLVSFLATNNGEVSVTLTNPLTKETIPGLVTKTQGGSYSITKVPDGTYIVRATYSNDDYVVDPDWILKNGEPIVTLSGNSVKQDFSVTGAVKLVSPTNEITTTRPIEITSLSPVFTWLAYSSTSDYVVEVSDINGNVIWGGFTKNGATITKNISVPKEQLSITFNSDGKATSTLKSNNIYRWRVYSSKDDNSSSTGWKLISVSEDQRGLFIVK
ncbi:MAG: carboxypeptidase-like regulatory domain-containing protein [Bacteroidota bacterium]|nr:carboxypeptidase-like regulatory domain-containing protein [Bacteroidota bacterium]